MAGYSPAINNQANLPQSTVKYVVVLTETTEIAKFNLSTVQL